MVRSPPGLTLKRTGWCRTAFIRSFKAVTARCGPEVSEAELAGSGMENLLPLQPRTAFHPTPLPQFSKALMEPCGWLRPMAFHHFRKQAGKATVGRKDYRRDELIVSSRTPAAYFGSAPITDWEFFRRVGFRFPLKSPRRCTNPFSESRWIGSRRCGWPPRITFSELAKMNCLRGL